MSARPRHLVAEDVGDLTLIRFNDRRILDAPLIRAIEEELLQLVDQQGRRKLLLNFAAVEYLSSAALTTLLALHKRLQKEGGRLVLCGIAGSVAEVFAVSRLDKLFTICEPEQQARQQLEGKS